jgi:hypothetical protein
MASIIYYLRMLLDALDVGVVNFATHFLKPQKHHYMDHVIYRKTSYYTKSIKIVKYITISNAVSQHVISPAYSILNVLFACRSEH